MVKALNGFDIKIDKKRVCRSLGYSNGHYPKPHIAALIDECAEEAYRLIEPSCSYLLMDITRIRRPRVNLENGVKMTVSSEVLSWVLYPCKQAVLFISSIGQGLEDKVARLSDEGQVLKATILDAIGSEAAEKTICYVQDRVREIANSDDAEITLRYSPGYCDWDITQQRAIFQAMASAPLQVSLSDECLMTPRKSISGIIGIGWGEKRRLRLSPCRFCTKTECSNRR